ncbi:Uncharacterized protein APZ42_028716 [Daphnia magna]|uniref:Uncharacterized protein n=1 Tax=Daphnia magna TaxID=35525 RepID=A0A164QB14_9CRUS|nr:Uncharacterized protein APZ42_028716 [Daphnia magna]
MEQQLFTYQILRNARLHWNRALNTCDYPSEANCPTA